MADIDETQVAPTDAGTPAPDLSQYIRTYAKDVAQVSGKGNIAAVQKKKVAAEPAVVPADIVNARGEVSDGVEFDATEQQFFEAQELKKDNPYAPIELESRAELDTFVEGNTSSPAPTTDAAAERAAVLARLRAKMTVPAMSAPVPDVPVFTEPTEAAVHTIPPLYREPIPEAVPAPQVQAERPAPPPQPKAPAGPARFHSFSTDFKDHSKANDSSSFSVLAAGLDAGQAVAARPAASRERPPVLAIVLGVVLLTLAAGGSYALYLYVGARHEVPVITLSVPSLIFADEYKKIEGNGQTLMEALATVATDPLPQGTALVTYVAQPATGETGTIAGSPAPGGVLVRALGLGAPELLLRNIEDESTVGVIHEGADTRAFFVLRVSSYERTFAGMLTWEPLMLRELGLLYPLYPSNEPEPVQVDLSTASTTASTTPVIASSTPPVLVVGTPQSVGRFEDAVVANRDVRILRDTQGRSLLLYGYADKQTLIIARSEAAFSALLVRLSAGGQ